MSWQRPRTLGEHEVLRVIAQGGMGTVLEVRNARTGVAYAAKMLNRLEDPQARARFKREAELLARCDRHSGIVKVHSYGETPEGSPYMILDLVKGESLEALLERERRLPPERAAALARDVAAALAFAHERGIVHRDVKPANVLLDAAGRPLLTDFGLARAGDVEKLTRTGAFVGTVVYTAPEQARGEPAGPAADVFSLGATLFHALAGSAPFAGDTAVAVFAALQSEAPARDVRLLAPEVPEPLARIVARALEKVPARRPQDGGALVRDLDRFLSGEPLERPARDHSRLARALAAVALLAVLGLGVALLAARVATQRAARDECRAALEAARKLVREPDGLDGARAALARARATRATSEDGEVEAVASEIAVAEAERQLARRDGAAALAALEGRALAPHGELVRGRALLLLGRNDEAARAAELASSAKEEELGALELEGDALLAGGGFGGALDAYARALRATSSRSVELRAKHAGAAALGGQRDAALADLDALKPAFAHAAKERLAGAAPALYLRALSRTDEARARELDAAWAIARPPLPMREAVAAALAEIRNEAATVLDTPPDPSRTEDMFRRLSTWLVSAARVRELGSHVDEPLEWEQLHGFRLWTERSLSFGVAVWASEGEKLLALWPDHPTILYLWGLKHADSEPARALEEFLRAADRLPPRTPGEPAEVSLLVDAIAHRAIEVTKKRADLVRVRPLVAQVGSANVWVRFAEHAFGLDALDLAGPALEAAERAPGAADEENARPLALARVDVLAASGDVDGAVALARRLHRSGAAGGAQALVRALRFSGDLEEALRLVRVDKERDAFLLRELASVAALAEGRPAVDAIAARLVQLDQQPKLVAKTRQVDGAADALWSLGVVERRDPARALATARKIYGVAPSPTTFHVLADTLYRHGERDELLKLAGEQVLLSDRTVELVQQALEDRGDLERARSHLAELEKVAPDLVKPHARHVAFLEAAAAARELRSRGRDAEAHDALARCIARYAGEGGRTDLLIALWSTRDDAELVRWVDPASAGAEELRWCGRALARLGRRKEALAVAERLDGMRPAWAAEVRAEK